MDKKIILVTGAARSGKSEWAEYLAKISQKPVIYIATSSVDETQEIPRQLSETIDNSPFSHCLLIDSLGTWVANCLEMSAAEWLEISDRFLYSLKNAAVDVILVAEETGWGVVPAYPLGRLFRDRLGDLCRRIGTIADAVYLVTGGHALNLSQLGQSLSIIGQ
ncbi:MAG: bifunctional adenosylcobinamide kinase/adenosylcobinamide-phosphate guanylyltransferase [Microcystis sp. 53602_E8]|nr:bifunctional adenosylcobinamide kinase/adenosylcobinamide-phosphate guanylyltransferase [Microcystis sp. 53602_E8]